MGQSFPPPTPEARAHWTTGVPWWFAGTARESHWPCWTSCPTYGSPKTARGLAFLFYLRGGGCWGESLMKIEDRWGDTCSRYIHLYNSNINIHKHPCNKKWTNNWGQTTKKEQLNEGMNTINTSNNQWFKKRNSLWKSNMINGKPSNQ